MSETENTDNTVLALHAFQFMATRSYLLATFIQEVSQHTTAVLSLSNSLSVLHSEQLHSLYRSSDIVRVIQSRRLIC